MTIRNRIGKLENKRKERTRSSGFFQLIGSKKDLADANQVVEAERVKHPQCKIPLYRVFLADWRSR